MIGHDIRVLQDFLTRARFKAAIDGRFGASTEKAVKAFEAAQNRPVDGMMDAGDIDALRSLAGQPDPGADSTPTTPVSQSTTPTPGDRAQIGPDGLAIAPASAPDPVKEIIAAGNEIATKPYRYGGGHAKWNDSGYDCSGSMSYALHGAGLLDAPLTSGGFATWGEAGAGQWVTVYANAGHSYMVVAGLRFDTSGRSKAGTRWQTDLRSSKGYAVRRAPGL
jgi:cell wall-associated NlpC family hydrolase